MQRHLAQFRIRPVHGLAHPRGGGGDHLGIDPQFLPVPDLDSVFGGTPRKTDHDLIASAIFTQPELGTVGLSEEDARDVGPIEVYCAAFRPMQAMFAGHEERVMMKLIVCADTRKVLGVHLVGDHAGELIQLVGIAVKMGATKEDFDATVAVHPTMSEELVTMKTPVRTA